MTAPTLDQELDGLLAVFHAETADNFETLEQALIALEAGGAVDAEVLHGMLRAAHTIKGNSAIVGYEDVTAAAHQLEDELERLRDGTTPFTASAVTTLLDAVDALRTLVRHHTTPAPAAAEPGAAATPAPAAQAAAPQRKASLRVETRRLDTLLDLTGEITIARGRLGQLLRDAATGDTTLSATLWQLEQLQVALHDEVMALRMVPLGPLFEAQRRTVRDTAARVEKQARLVIEGHDVDVDTAIAEQLRDPLTHMIRNAIDHGIESPAERAAAGKPAAGTIVLSASHRSGMVLIELRDDGRGLHRAKIAAKAEAQGLIASSAGMSDDEVFALIFEPGFSTAASVTEVSGRGVGMDVVRRHVQALRGTVDVSSAPGAGTRFVIRLPLTIAIISGFTVGIGEERYVIPLETVEEVLDASAFSDASAPSGLLELRGSAVPWLKLRDVLGLPATACARPSAVIVRHGEQRLALLVDVLDGDCQAVIKPLSSGLAKLDGIAGSTILGDGRVAFILNVPDLVGRFGARAGA